LQRVSIFEDFRLKLAGHAVLEHASLSVLPGEVLVIMGPSGVGKSLLTDAVFSLLETSATVEASDVNPAVARQGCVVFQHAGGLPHLSVRQNLRLVAATSALADEALQASGLAPNASPERLSGGEKRRLAVQRALATGKPLLWFDEPAAGLDVHRSETLAKQLRAEAQDHGRAVIVVEHQPAFICAVADRVVWMLGDGHLQEVPPEVWADEAILSQHFRDAVQAAPAGSEDEGWSHPAFRWAMLAWPLRPLRWLRSLPYALLWPLGFFSSGWSLAVRSAGVAWSLTGLRGIPYFAAVSAIFSLIFLLVFELAVAFVDPSAVVARMGPQVLLRVAPVLACLLAAAQAGSSLTAWLGTMQSQRQLDALRVLHAPVERGLIAPTWFGGMLGVLCSAFVFAAVMALVFAGYLHWNAPEMLDSYVQALRALPWMNALGRTLLFSAVVASVAVDESLEVRRQSDSVARAVTASIVWGTIWVIASEALILAIELL